VVLIPNRLCEVFAEERFVFASLEFRQGTELIHGKVATANGTSNRFNELSAIFSLHLSVVFINRVTERSIILLVERCGHRLILINSIGLVGRFNLHASSLGRAFLSLSFAERRQSTAAFHGAKTCEIVANVSAFSVLVMDFQAFI
jgi:hypothetical protein